MFILDKIIIIKNLENKYNIIIKFKLFFLIKFFIK